MYMYYFAYIYTHHTSYIHQIRPLGASPLLSGYHAGYCLSEEDGDRRGPTDLVQSPSGVAILTGEMR